MTGEVSQWLKGLTEGDDLSAQRLWEIYFDKIVRLAQRRLGGANRRMADEEDVAISAFHSLCRGAAAGKFNQLENRDDLAHTELSGLKQGDGAKPSRVTKGPGNGHGTSDRRCVSHFVLSRNIVASVLEVNDEGGTHGPTKSPDSVHRQLVPLANGRGVDPP